MQSAPRYPNLALGNADSRSARSQTGLGHPRTASPWMRTTFSQQQPPTHYEPFIETIQGSRPASPAGSGNPSPTNATEDQNQSAKSTHRPFACEYPSCGMAFDGNWRLKRHQLTHANQKAWKCPIERPRPCLEEFNNLSNFRRHAKNKHGGFRGKLEPIQLRG
jgi:hypothetical protein